MTALTESTHAGEFLLSEGNGTQSRENVSVTVAANTTLAAGALLALSGSTYIPVTANLVAAQAALGVLYDAITNDTEAQVNFDGAIIARLAEVRGDDMDWNSMVHASQDAAILLLAGQGIIVRDYIVPEDGS